ncbi:DUF6716 putative glycosyltransferase [Nonomuraea soli]|uniref:Uncharacterized protein n=1 Tax=Nonomuraea soli TaxID=1032476 RepID=A0A7W0CG64_9ACTN|nr:DUF6716 putative glycosyltransferase [Nonomuraea soli]MBA2890586.1 hypothetical protein [Nonomuraea soli]
MKILAVADSDSYLKWAASLLGDLPDGCRTELAVIRTPIVPSAEQIAAAVGGRPAPPVLSARSLRRTAERLRPDAVLVACTGPVVDVLVSEVLKGLGAVFVTGLPGIAVPATEKAWLFRSACDLFVAHSGREVAEFEEIGRRLGGGGSVGLARLPFLRSAVPAGAEGGSGSKVVFATQAKVPVAREERERILLALAELAAARPELEVVVKLRALEGERQTHNERHPYQRLWRELGEPGRLTFAAGPMGEHLAGAAGFVTVSSTAALEAIAWRVPSLVLDDFGVSAEMINLVFEGSGLLGDLGDLARGDFRAPLPGWCEENYFQRESTWVGLLTALVAGPRTQPRSLLEGPAHEAARRRARLRVEVPPRLLRVGYRAKRRLRRVLS